MDNPQAICMNCGVIQSDQIDGICVTCQRRELMSFHDLRTALQDRKAANDVLRAENRGLFDKCEALEKANKEYEIVIYEF